MAKPWENYQAPEQGAGPWTQYQQGMEPGPWTQYQQAAQPKAPERPGFFGAFFESAKTLGLADEATRYADNPNEENRRKLLDAAKSKYESVGFGEGENWEAFKELLGGSLGQLVAPAITATGTALLTRAPGRAVKAGMATSAAQYGTQNILRQAQEQERAATEGRVPEEFSLTRSVISSAGQTALDYAGFKYFKPLFEAFPLLKNLVGASDEAAEAAAKAVTDAAERGAIKSTRYGTALIEAGKGAAFEIPQEVAQQALERWQAGLSLTDADAREEFKQAAIGAAILGPLMGGAKGFVTSTKATTEEETDGGEAPPPPPPPPAGETAAPPSAPGGIPPEAFAAAKDYADKVGSGEVQFNLFTARKLIRNMGYEIDKDSKLAYTKSLLNDILTAKAPDLGMLTTGEFVPEMEVPSGADVTTAAGQTITEPVGRGDVVPPSGVGAAEPGVTEPTGAGLVPADVFAEEPDVGEAALSPALTSETYTFDDGSSYTGKVDSKSGLFEGVGAYTTPTGDVFQGTFKKGRLNGVGTLTFTDGSVYNGGFKDYKFHGEGEFVDADGSVMRGMFKAGKFLGEPETVTEEKVEAAAPTASEQRLNLIKQTFERRAAAKAQAEPAVEPAAEPAVEPATTSEPSFFLDPDRPRFKIKTAEEIEAENKAQATTSEPSLSENATDEDIARFFNERNRIEAEKKARAKLEEDEDTDADRVYKSVDVLNRTAPDVSEQSRERAPSLRTELKKAKQKYDEGQITGDQLAETTGNLLLETQKERIVQPRKRGADYIRERLMNARRKGLISQEGIDIAEWFIRQNPLLVDDLGISIRGQPLTEIGTGGFYNPVGRIVTLFKSAGDSQTATHEILHHLERLMPSNIRSGILKAYVKQLTKAAKNAKTDAEKAFFNAITNYHYFTDETNRNAEYEKALDAIRNGQVPKSFYQYVNPSEFWAVNGARIVQGRYEVSPSIIGQLKNWLRDFIEKVKDVFGLKSDAAAIRALDSLAKADGKYQTDRMLSEAPGYRAVEPTDRKGQTPEQAIKTRQDTYKQRYGKVSITDRILKYVSGREAGSRRLDKFEAIVKKFQNELRPALLLERALKRAGELITYGPGMNDAYTKITNAQDKAAWLTSTMLKGPMDRAYKAIEKYARSRNLTTDQAIEELDRFRIVLHEPERRMIMFMRYVPLSTKRRAFRDSNGRTIQISPAELRDSILRALVKPGNDLVSNGQAKQLHKLLKALVSDKNNLDPLGASPIKKEGKPMSTDINDEQYNVLGGYSPAFIAKWANTFNALGTQKPPAEAAIKAIEDVQNVTAELNRMAKYWTKPVDNIVAFYDFKHYTPFKGVPGTKVRAEAEMTDPNDVRISGEFADADQAMEGRESEADNSVLQSLSDALYAASRAGRAGVTEAVKNLIEQGHVSGRKVAEVTHEQRYLDKDFDFKKFKGKNKLFHYNDAGNIEVYEIANKDIDFLESIRRPYQVDNLGVRWGNNITGFFGQMHTRYNPSFAPLNFPRDIFTNTLAISADVGGKEAATYLADALFRNVMKGGLHKSGNVSKLLNEGKIAELEKLAKTDPFYNDVIEWMQEGGRTTYQQIYSMQAQANELEALIGPKGVSPYDKTKEAIQKWADIYNDAFEFTSRVAAYGVMKGNVMARLKQEFRDKNKRSPNAQETAQIEQAARTEAASFAKNLANFRLIGTAGREAGALFMFFRAGATGAVRAIDAIMPALVDEKTALSKAPASIRDNPEASKRFLNNYKENKRRAQYTIFATAAAGAFLYSLALAGADDDEQGRNSVATDDMARWTRYARLPILGKDTFLQIPWGFGISAFGAMGAQVAALAAGNESFKDFTANIINIAFDSFIPIPKSNINVFDNFTGFLVDSVTPSALRPVVEYAMNTDNLGNEIYNNRQSRYSDVFTGGSNVPDLYKDMARNFFDFTNVEVSPNSMYFWATNYADALNRVASATYDLKLFASGQRELRSIDDLDRTLVPLDSFIGTRSNYDARQYQDVKEQVEQKQRLLKSLELRPDAFRRYLEKYPTDIEIVDFYNHAINDQLKSLQEQAKYIRLSSQFNQQQRRDLLKENTRMQNLAKRNMIDTFKLYGIEPET